MSELFKGIQTAVPPPAAQGSSRPTASQAQSVSSDSESAQVVKLPSGGTTSGTTSVDAGQETEKLAQELQEFAQRYDRALKFSVNKETGNTVITVTDSEGVEIRKIPSEEIQRLQAYFAEVSESIESDKAAVAGILFRGSS